jgi:hypothetical protein
MSEHQLTDGLVGLDQACGRQESHPGDDQGDRIIVGVGGFKNRSVMNGPNTRNTRTNASRIGEWRRNQKKRSATTNPHHYGQLTGKQ